MLKWVLLTLLSLNSFALEISMDSAKDEFVKYSTLHLTNNDKFLCQEIKDDFDNTTQIVCAFSKKPLKHIKSLQNNFFKVNTFIKNETFFISIKPFFKLKLIPKIFDLTKDETLYTSDVSLSNEWVIIGYKDILPLLEEKETSSMRINFPFYSDFDKFPYVGSLDLAGNPVHINEVGDVEEYLNIKKYYSEKKYERCMEAVEDVLESYPDTLFKAELIFYKIRLYSKLKDYDNVISNSKIYLREYSSDANIPEVLALTAKAYGEIGIKIDADYFFDRLFSEHADSVYTQWGYIYKGELLESSGGASKAVSFYKKALYETADLEVAATAAFKLANLKLGSSSSSAAKYIKKIVKAKPDYFMQEYVASKEMMQTFADDEEFLTSSMMAGAMLDELDATYDDYEELLYNKAYWLSKTDEKQDALVALNKYLSQFPDGDYLDKIQVAKDAMFFQTTDSNTSSLLTEYDKLIEEYSNDSIGNRARYEKAKLLLQEKHFTEVLESREELMQLDEEKYSDIDEIIKNAAIGQMNIVLKAKECKEVLHISNEYNVTISNEWDDGVYECAMKGGDYQLSRSIVLKNIKSKDLDLRKKWLYRYIKVNFTTGNYSDVIGASKDLIVLIQNDKNSSYKDVYRYLFDTYDRSEKKDNMLSAMADIEKVYGLDYKDIERYISVMSIGSQTKDDNIVINYGKKVMQIQKSSESNAQSPYVEFTLYQSYMDRGDYNKALIVIESLNSVEISSQDRARQKYMLGTVLTKLWRDSEADAAYNEAINADKESAWAKLAQSALKI